MVAASLGLLFGGMQSVRAHGDDPRLEISPARLSPGVVLDLRGVDFEAEEEAGLFLVGSGVEFPLGNAVAGTDGVFLLPILIPADLAEGTYTIRATTDDHQIDSPPVTVSGLPVGGEGGEGLREAEDGLLAPMPTYPSATQVDPSPTYPPPTAVLPLPTAGEPSRIGAGLSLQALALGGLAVLAFAFVGWRAFKAP